MTKTVCLIGRPNVGKSTIFNKLLREKKSIILDTPGITRDRIYGTVTYKDKKFDLIDTGGIDLGKDDFNEDIKIQASLAIEESDLILFVVDGKEDLTNNDFKIRDMLIKSNKEVIVVANKIDNEQRKDNIYAYYELGFEKIFPVSGEHNLGFNALLDEITKDINPPEFEFEDDILKFCIIGRPNVGKSSLINALLNEERAIVSDVAGTTRDATDTEIENENGKFVFIDTAGIRRKSKVLDSVEKYSVLRSYMAVDRADVAVIVIDATEGFTEQDSKVAGYAHEKGKACIVAVNKWDAIEKETNTMDEYRKKLQDDFSFMSYVPFVFISAKTGLRVEKLFDYIKYVAEQNAVRIPTGRLNDVLAYATARVQPPSDKGRRLKIYYMTQASTKPPTFIAFVNRADLFHFSYQRYIENQIRETFSLDATPIRMKVRERDTKDVK